MNDPFNFDGKVIKKALYGLSCVNSIDVTEKFNNCVMMNKINKDCNINDLLTNDPFPGMPKKLFIYFDNPPTNLIIFDEYRSKLILNKSENVPTIDELKILNHSICFSICITTYKRPCGSIGKCNFQSTSQFLTRCIDSILTQTYQKYRIIVVGDKYEDLQELKSIIDKFRRLTSNEIILIQNESTERDYIMNKNKLWRIAGSSSMNVGLNYCRTNNYIYYCHLDDNDWWEPDHLETFAKIYTNYIDVVFVNSMSTFDGKQITTDISDKFVFKCNIMPREHEHQVCDSSISFRADIVPFNYFTTKNEDEITLPANAMMLNNIHNFIIDSDGSCICTKKFTCHHDTKDVKQ